MMNKLFLIMLFIFIYSETSAQNYGKDVIQTSKGPLAITFLGHATLMMEFNGKVIHIDPVGQYADYSRLPKADLVLVTHSHYDHFDMAAIAKIREPGTEVVCNALCLPKLPGSKVMKNGESATFKEIPVEAVPAYNIRHERAPGQPFHPKGEGNGYILHFGDLTVYIAGDTENTPEMKKLKDIDVAFLPMNLPYTMTPEMVADAVRAFKPKILYPYHYGDTDTGKLVQLLKNDPVEVRIRNLR